MEIKLGDIYGIYNKYNKGYHPYIVVLFSNKKVYCVQASSVKIKKPKYYLSTIEETDYFLEKEGNSYVLKNYEDTPGLKYKTAVSVSSIWWNQEIKEHKYLGRIQKRDFINIINELDEISLNDDLDGINDKQFHDLIENTIKDNFWEYDKVTFTLSDDDY